MSYVVAVAGCEGKDKNFYFNTEFWEGTLRTLGTLGKGDESSCQLRGNN